MAEPDGEERLSDEIPVDIAVFLTDDLDVLAHLGITVPDENGELSTTCLVLDERQLLIFIAALCQLHDLLKDVSATSMEERRATMERHIKQLKAPFN